MVIVATDADHLKPTVIDTLVYTSGERYDFVLEANQTIGEAKLGIFFRMNFSIFSGATFCISMRVFYEIDVHVNWI